MRRLILLLTVAFIPLIIHLHFVEFPLEVMYRFRTSQFQSDIFNWCKNFGLYGASMVLLFWGWRKPKTFFNKCIALYLSLVVISSIMSRYPEVVWFGMPNYLEGTLAIASYCILFLTAADLRLEISAFQTPLAFCTWLMFIAAALQYFNPQWFQIATHFLVFGTNKEYQMAMETWPLFGTLMNQNILGTFAAIVYPMFLARRRWLLTLVAVLLAVGSQSRGAWFAMVIATLYLGLKYRTWKLAIPLSFFAVGIAVVYLHPTRGGFKWTLQSSGRIYVWQKTATILDPSALLYGYGPGAFAMDFPQDDAVGKRAQGWTPETIVDRPHNFYLQVLHASGGISLIALLLLFAGFLLESKEVAINAAVLSYLVNVFFTDSCTSVAPIFWILLGTGVGRLKKF